MAALRIEWGELPEETMEAVENHTGPIRAARTVAEGLNSSIAAIVDTQVGAFFVKGLPTDHPRHRTQDQEALINPSIAHLSAPLLWRIEAGGWDLLGYSCLAGRHADFRPGSGDLPAIMSTLAELGTIPCPDLPIKTAEDRWRTYVAASDELVWLQGDRLLHTDYRSVNILMTGSGARLVDWAWPTRGAGWIDPACLIVHLIAAGHSAEEAERVVSGLPAWKNAPPEGLEILARANAHLWQEIQSNDSAEWIQTLAVAAKGWERHRTQLARRGSLRRTHH